MLTQSVVTLQAFPAAHAGALLPPQSTSVSVPFFFPSVALGSGVPASWGTEGTGGAFASVWGGGEACPASTRPSCGASTGFAAEQAAITLPAAKAAENRRRPRLSKSRALDNLRSVTRLTCRRKQLAARSLACRCYPLAAIRYPRTAARARLTKETMHGERCCRSTPWVACDLLPGARGCRPRLRARRRRRCSSKCRRDRCR